MALMLVHITDIYIFPLGNSKWNWLLSGLRFTFCQSEGREGVAFVRQCFAWYMYILSRTTGSTKQQNNRVQVQQIATYRPHCNTLQHNTTPPPTQ